MRDIGFHFRASGSSTANNTQDEENDLIKACQENMDLQEVENLLEHSDGSIINKVDTNGNTALMIATQKENDELVELLM